MFSNLNLGQDTRAGNRYRVLAHLWMTRSCGNGVHRNLHGCFILGRHGADGSKDGSKLREPSRK